MAGIGDLFTTDFYDDVNAALADDGVFVQWFHSYETTDEVLSLVARTLLSRFPVVYTFEPHSNDIAFIASRQPLARDYPAMAARLTEPVVRSLSRAQAPTTLPGIMALQTLSPVSIHSLAGQGPVNSLSRPILEFEAPRGFFERKTARLVRALDERRYGDGSQLLAAGLGEEGREAVARAVRAPDKAAKLRERAAAIEADVQAGRRDPSALWEVVDLLTLALEQESDSLSPTPSYDAVVRRAARLARELASDRAVMGDLLLRSGRPEEAVREFGAAVALAKPGDPLGVWLAHLAHARALSGDLYGAAEALGAAEAEGAPALLMAKVRATLALSLAKGGSGQ
jgi:hypothetical protein